MDCPIGKNQEYPECTDTECEYYFKKYGCLYFEVSEHRMMESMKAEETSVRR